MIRIIQKRKFFLTFSTLAVIGSILALFFWGLNFGVDFTGGSLLEVGFKNYQPTVTEIQDSLKDTGLHGLVVQPTNDSVILRFKESNEASHQAVMAKLQSLAASKTGASVTELQFDAVGSSIGQELKSKSFNATAIVFIMIIVFISWAFRKVSKPVAS